MDSAALFQPFTCKSLRLKNRIVMAPTARWASPDGNPGPLAEYYRARVLGGASLVMTEGAAINRPASYNDPRNFRIFGPALEGWPKLVAAVHDAGGAIIPQLWHAGSVAKKASEWQPGAEPESPSGLVSAGQPRGRAMTDVDLAAVLDAFVEAAEACVKFKLDGVEVHAGHGYLLDQFFWDQTNRRDDRWGGKTLAERAGFPLEVVKTVRKTIGDELPLVLRISNWKSAGLDVRMFETPRELEDWLLPFTFAGVDIFSVSMLRYDEPIFPDSPLSFAGWVKKVTGCSVIAAGGIGMSGDLISTFGGETGLPLRVDDVARRISAGEFDLVGVGRALAADPFWPQKIAEDRFGEICPCTPQQLAPQLPLD
jgi:2,4-dienoyl-CoA reductase-like NADH-dependent reductase (Old Yellow Enzyme family)